MGIPRSSVFYKAKAYPKRKLSLRKSIDKQAAAAIEKITGNKATYGVPRVKAILKRDYSIELSRYMVHRYMKENNLLIKRSRTRATSSYLSFEENKHNLLTSM